MLSLDFCYLINELSELRFFYVARYQIWGTLFYIVMVCADNRIINTIITFSIMYIGSFSWLEKLQSVRFATGRIIDLSILYDIYRTGRTISSKLYRTLQCTKSGKCTANTVRHHSPPHVLSGSTISFVLKTFTSQGHINNNKRAKEIVF